MRHFTSPEFWKCYQVLPKSARRLADKNFDILKADLRHPSLHFKKVKNFHSVRVGLFYRALAVDVPGGIPWFWVGDHSSYDKLVREY